MLYLNMVRSRGTNNNFWRMKARAAVRDIGRVMNIPLSRVDQLAKLLPADATLDYSINNIPQVKEIYVNDLELQRVLDYAKRLENTIHLSSIHAAGICNNWRTTN